MAADSDGLEVFNNGLEIFVADRANGSSKVPSIVAHLSLRLLSLRPLFSLVNQNYKAGKMKVKRNLKMGEQPLANFSKSGKEGKAGKGKPISRACHVTRQRFTFLFASRQ